MRRRLSTTLLACLAVGALAPSGARASSTQESTFQDDNQLIFPDPPSALPGTLDRLALMGVDRLRVSVFWGTVAPDALKQDKPGFDASDPAAYPTGVVGWDRYDRLVRLAAARGLKVNFDVTSPAPYWATQSLAGRPDLDKDYLPDPAEFAAFVKAAGTRYSGSYVPPAPPASSAPASTQPGLVPPFGRRDATDSGPVPRVDYWTIWNEPNQPGWLTPQWVDHGKGTGMVETAPGIYRALADAMWGSLQATGHGKDTILLGETAPKGQERVTGPTRALKPARFIRNLYCLDDHLQFFKGDAATLRGCPTSNQAAQFAAAHPGLFAATGYAHHPYETIFAPTRPPSTPDNFTTGNLPQLSKLLRRIYLRYGQRIPGGGRDVPLYLTENGYQTNPPDPAASFSLAKQAEYSNAADYVAWANPRVRTLTQFLLVDDKPIDAPTPLKAYGGTSQSGLLFADGSPKPALAAYALPVYLPAPRVAKGRRLRVWGLVRQAVDGTAPMVQVQVRAARKGSAFTTVSTVRGTAARGYVSTTVPVRSAGVLRLRWRGPAGFVTSREAPFSVR